MGIFLINAIPAFFNEYIERFIIATNAQFVVPYNKLFREMLENYALYIQNETLPAFFNERCFNVIIRNSDITKQIAYDFHWWNFVKFVRIEIWKVIFKLLCNIALHIFYFNWWCGKKMLTRVWKGYHLYTLFTKIFRLRWHCRSKIFYIGGINCKSCRSLN